MFACMCAEGRAIDTRRQVFHERQRYNLSVILTLNLTSTVSPNLNQTLDPELRQVPNLFGLLFAGRKMAAKFMNTLFPD